MKAPSFFTASHLFLKVHFQTWVGQMQQIPPKVGQAAKLPALTAFLHRRIATNPPENRSSPFRVPVPLVKWARNRYNSYIESKEAKAMPTQEIEELKDRLVAQLSPVQVYLFGSFASGADTPDSDFDFYIVVEDSGQNLADLTAAAYRAVRKVKKRPVDILVGTTTGFEARKNIPSVEREVYRKGVLLYGN